MSLLSDMFEIADSKRRSDFDAAVAKTLQECTFHLAYYNSRGEVETETFPGVASAKTRKLRDLGLDDASKFCSIAQRADGSWTELCGNKELAKHLSGVPAKFRR